MSDDESVGRCICDRPFFLYAACHPAAGLRVSLMNGSDRLLVVCGVCGEIVMGFVLEDVVKGLSCELCGARRREEMT